MTSIYSGGAFPKISFIYTYIQRELSSNELDELSLKIKAFQLELESDLVPFLLEVSKKTTYMTDKHDT